MEISVNPLLCCLTFLIDKMGLESLMVDNLMGKSQLDLLWSLWKHVL